MVIKKETKPFEDPACPFFGPDGYLGVKAGECALRFNFKDKRCVQKDGYQPPSQEEIKENSNQGDGCRINTRKNRDKLDEYLEGMASVSSKIQIEYFEANGLVEQIDPMIVREAQGARFSDSHLIGKIYSKGIGGRRS